MTATTHQHTTNRNPVELDIAEVAHEIRDRMTALWNALEVVRLAAGGNPAVARGLRLADRQIAALVRLAEGLHDPRGTAPRE
jgi:hypothetical protein